MLGFLSVHCLHGLGWLAMHCGLLKTSTVAEQCRLADRAIQV